MAFSGPGLAVIRRENAPRADFGFSRVWAATRRAVASRLVLFRFLPDLFLPPDWLDPGLVRNQDVKCFTVGNAFRDGPNSARRVTTAPVLSESLCVRSCPRI